MKTAYQEPVVEIISLSEILLTDGLNDLNALNNVLESSETGGGSRLPTDEDEGPPTE